jgi:uncharacterized membrane protein
MGDFQASTTVDATGDELFAYLSTVGNLPRYFPQMTSATPGDGEEVHTAARLPGGQHVQGDAWFRVDRGAHRLEWGSEGPNSYHGSLEVSDTAGNTEVRVRLHTTRVPDGDDEVRQGLDDTLGNIKRLVEQHHVTR